VTLWPRSLEATAGEQFPGIVTYEKDSTVGVAMMAKLPHNLTTRYHCCSPDLSSCFASIR